MKFCIKCGTALEDHMEFCHKCGIRAFSVPGDVQQHTQASIVLENTVPHIAETTPNAKPRLRVSMLVWAIIFFVFGTVPTIVNAAAASGASPSSDPIALYLACGMTAWFYILSGMFLILMKSPKGNPYLFNKSSGLRKVGLVHLCIWVGFAIYLTMILVGGINAAAG